MNKLFKVASLLLSYPTAELQDEVPALCTAVEAESRLPRKIRNGVIDLVNDIGGRELYEAEERYVYLFDRTRTLSLHLFEHVHGESRDRGQAMVDLKRLYEDAGMVIDVNELPDYLPLFLEFLSLLDDQPARELLGQVNHILVVLRSRLQKRDSVYGNIFAALEAVANGKPENKIVSELLAQPDHDPDDLSELDKVWEEDPVTFAGNVGDATCGLDRIRVQARAAQRKPDDPPAVAPSTLHQVGGQTNA